MQSQTQEPCFLQNALQGELPQMIFSTSQVLQSHCVVVALSYLVTGKVCHVLP